MGHRSATFTKLFLFGVLTQAAAACSVRLEVDDTTEISCESDDDCPPGRSCRAGLCLSSDQFSAPPARIAAATIEPSRARVGDVLRVSLQIEGEIRGQPQLVLATAARTPFTFLERGEDGSYRYELLVSRALPEGVTSAAASFVDVGGNAVADASITTTITLDFTPPGASAIAVDSTLPVRLGDERLVSMVANEALASATATTDTGFTLTQDTVAVTPEHRSAFVSSADMPEGTHIVVLTLQDLAGNVSVVSDAARLVVDKTAPGLAETPLLSRSVARANQLVSTTLRFDERLSQLPSVIAVSRADGSQHTFDVREIDASSVGASLEVLPTFSSGTYDVLAQGARDLAGNQSEAITFGSITIDSEAPTFVLPPTTDRSAASKQSGHDVVTVNFSLSDYPCAGADPVPAAVIELRVGSRSGELCTHSSATMGVGFSCRYTVSNADTEGPRFLSVRVTDIAGNERVASIPDPLRIDLSPPSFIITAGSQATPVRTGQTRSVTIQVNEGLAGASGSAGGIALSSGSATPPSYSFGFTPDAVIADGIYAASLVLSDEVGNTTTSTNAFDVIVDNTAPQLAGAPQLSASQLRAGQTLVITFASNAWRDAGCPSDRTHGASHYANAERACSRRQRLLGKRDHWRRFRLGCVRPRGGHERPCRQCTHERFARLRYDRHRDSEFCLCAGGITKHPQPCARRTRARGEHGLRHDDDFIRLG
jgi:hypothetical protein